MERNDNQWALLFAYICFVCAMLLLMTGCQSTKVVGKSESTIDSTYMEIKSKTDSLTNHTSEIKDKEQVQTIIKDSIVYVVDTTGKVVTVDRWHYQDRWRDRLVEIHDTMFVKVEKQDSVTSASKHDSNSEVVVEKKKGFFARLKDGAYTMWILMWLAIGAYFIWNNRKK